MIVESRVNINAYHDSKTKVFLYYDNSKYKELWVDPGQLSIDIESKRNIHGSKILLCIWWDMKGIVLFVKISNVFYLTHFQNSIYY